jgi:hypothetical protein
MNNKTKQRRGLRSSIVGEKKNAENLIDISLEISITYIARVLTPAQELAVGVQVFQIRMSPIDF